MNGSKLTRQPMTDFWHIGSLARYWGCGHELDFTPQDGSRRNGVQSTRSYRLVQIGANRLLRSKIPSERKLKKENLLE